MNSVHTTTSNVTAEQVERDLRLLGFQPGAPKHFAPHITEIDRRAARAMRCGSCGKRGLTYSPFSRGREYRAVVACVKCQQFAEEM